MWTSRLFQFLGRNSGRSDTWVSDHETREEAGFNSSVGILVVRTSAQPVLASRYGRSFNSSVGILVVRTRGILLRR